MDSARETSTGETWNIKRLAEAERRDPGSWERLKADHDWVCPGCGRSAWAVRPSRNGNAARWAARHPENPPCDLSGRRVNNVPGGVDPEHEAVENTGTVLNLLFEYGGRPGQRDENHADGEDNDPGGRRGRGHADGERRAAHERTQHIGVLLGHLMADEGFVAGMDGQRIRVPERGEVRPEDLIWKLDDLDPGNPDLMGKHVVVWGPVASANRQARTGDWYLNQGVMGRNKGAVVVSGEIAGDLVDRYADHVEGFGDFGDWYVIAYGLTTTMGGGRQVRLSAADASAVVLRRAR